MDKNINTPKVTVFMPAYNAELFVADAIQSILNQTLRDFEFLIINDGSTDNTSKILSSFKDARIRLVTHERNLGLLETLNEGMRLATGKYIARMDSDDISLPTRLEKQVAFLDTHLDFVLVGTATQLIEKDGKLSRVIWKNTTRPEKIPVTLLFHNCFTHPSVMLRRSSLPTPAFRPGLTPAEDYDLWIRMTRSGKAWNLPEILLHYRIHGKNISTEKSLEKEKAVEKMVRAELERIDLSPSSTEWRIHKTNYTFTGSHPELFLEERERWLLKLIEANNKKGVYDEQIFKSAIADRWLASCYANARLGIKVWKRCFNSVLAEHLSRRENWCTILKFAIKVLFTI